jgi:hypothetical protein
LIRRDVGVLLVTATLTACTPAPVGPAPPSCPRDRAREVVLASQTEVARFAGCATLPRLIIRSAGPLDVSQLHALTWVTGDLVIGPTVAVQQIVLRELRSVDGSLHLVANSLVQGLYLPRLERAGRIDIDGNAALTTISLPRLAEVRGALRITDNASLELVDLPGLATIDDALVVSGVPKLTLLEAGAVRAAGGVEIDAPRLPAEVVDKLRER